MSGCDLAQWTTSPEYLKSNLNISPAKFHEVTNLLLERPNLNSSHLFRADIFHDSAGVIETLKQKEQSYGVSQSHTLPDNRGARPDVSPPVINGYSVTRTIVRRLIPRNPHLDAPLEQSCFIYKAAGHDSTVNSSLVVYVPHVGPDDKMPWYHPPVRALVYKYQFHVESAQISVHYLPSTVSSNPIPDRLHRTFISLLNTMIRLCRSDKPGTNLTSPAKVNSALSDIPVPNHRSLLAPSARSVLPSVLKDTILPQHTVQDTYARLKQKYATDLINRWIEKTEPSKHVFEDISIAAFLIELWKRMYGDASSFPGFVDIACGNGVLVYVLIQEGYQGCGFDARRRKTWEILGIDKFINEKICVPRPFLDAISEEESSSLDMAIHDGILSQGTFIISNHADELTPWTPILAALSSPVTPLPFLAIPCCSHSLSGGRHRYTIKEIDVAHNAKHNDSDIAALSSNDNGRYEPQPNQGDLKALRAQGSRGVAEDKSQYACLTKKVVALAEELKFDVEMTLMRIPSTRNIGIVGNRRKVINTKCRQQPDDEKNGALPKNNQRRVTEGDGAAAGDMEDNVTALIRRECAASGGISGAATTWIERAKKLQGGAGRGKVNLGHKPDADERQRDVETVVAHQD